MMRDEGEIISELGVFLEKYWASNFGILGGCLLNNTDGEPSFTFLLHRFIMRPIILCDVPIPQGVVL
jgi:hypothetical protein